MPSPQKEKGKRFERDVAKFLSDTFNKPFMRVPNSGAFTGGTNQHRIAQLDSTQVKVQRGDIVAPDDFNFVIECKNHRNFSTGFAGILNGANKVLDGWLDEVYKDSNNAQIPYALVFKITGEASTMFFALPEYHFKDLLQDNETLYTRYYHKSQDQYYRIISQHTFTQVAQKLTQVLRQPLLHT